MRALNIIPVFFLVGSVLLLILTIINGAGTSSVLGKFYWSETDTSGLTGVPYIKQDGRFIECVVLIIIRMLIVVNHRLHFLILQKIILVEIVVFLKISLMIEIPIIIYPELDGHLYLLIILCVTAMVAAPLNFVILSLELLV